MAVTAFAIWAVSGYLVHLRDGVFDRGDPLLTAWILAWDQRQIAHDPLKLFEANIFYPFHDTLAYSENMLGVAILAAPARLVTRNPVAIQNVSFLTAFAALALCGYFFFLWLSGDRIAAAIGALALSFSPVRAGQLGNVQLLHTAGFPLLLYALWAHFRERRRFAPPLLALSVVFEALCSLYLGVMAVLVVLLFALAAGYGFGLRKTAGGVGRLLPWGVAAGLVLAPLALPYWRLAHDFRFVRPIEGQWALWASHKDYFRPLQGSLAGALGGGWTLPAGKSLYLGAMVLLLAGTGFLTHRDPKSLDRTRFAVLLLAVMGIVSFTLSLGGWRTLLGTRVFLPFYWLHRLPGFEGIRAAFRFAILVDLAVVGLAVLGVAWLRRNAAERLGRLPAAVLAGALGALAVAERAPRLPLQPRERIETGDETPHVYRWLASDPGRAGVLELPMAVEGREREPWDVVPYRDVFYSTVHWKSIVNGTGGYQPPGYSVLVERMSEFPSEGALRRLRLLPIDRVVVHRRLHDFPIHSDLFGKKQGFRILHDCPDDLVLAVDPQPARKQTLSPRLEIVAGRSGELRGRVLWSERLPELIYPPARARMTVEIDRGSEGKLRAGIDIWLSEPRLPGTYRILPGPSARRVSLQIATETGEKAQTSRVLSRPKLTS
ncbi:MAG TPA: hypothetical protein VGQ75_01145 [Thermoanaerobaculia bacterium]|nr:hypothetical protein [Thermoanaerobaculia bacterium]